MARPKDKFEEFISDPKRHRIFEREALAFRASELVSQLMDDNGINKRKLAELVGASKSHITQLLSGSRNMTMHTLADLAFVLGHKIELTSLPLGAQEACRQYIQLMGEDQSQMFGGYSPLPSGDSADEYCDDADDEMLPAAA